MTIEMEFEAFAEFICREYTNERGELLMEEEDDIEFDVVSYKTAAREFIKTIYTLEELKEQ